MLNGNHCSTLALLNLIRRIERFHSRGQHLCKFIGTKESVCIWKEFNSQRTSLEHQHGRCFIVLEHQYGRRDITAQAQGVLPSYMAHTGMCRWTGHGLWPLCPKRGIIYCVSVLNRVYKFVWYCQQGIACTIDLICWMNFVWTPSIEKQWLWREFALACSLSLSQTA